MQNMDANDYVVLTVMNAVKDSTDWDYVKVIHWLTTGNMNFGGSTPLRLIENNKTDKLLKWIEASKDGF